MKYFTKSFLYYQQGHKSLSFTSFEVFGNHICIYIFLFDIVKIDLKDQKEKKKNIYIYIYI